MAIITMNHVTAFVLGGSLLTGDMGFFLIISCLWFPIAASIKMEVEIVRPIRKAMQDSEHTVQIEGSTVKVTQSSASPDPMAVGMSMGNP
tara:strand:- start:4763 stop:5032 length:270 start_codon:yes stop_codon:yes gene_type:complete